MKKLIIAMLMIIMGSAIMAEPASPYNGIIWYKSYTTFAAASKDIRFFGNFDGDIEEYTSAQECDLDSYGWVQRTDINLQMKMSCHIIGYNEVYDAVIYIYGNDKIATIQNKIRNGGTHFVFPKLIYSEVDSYNEEGYIYYQ
jgi:hypothetical protein